MLRQAKLTGMMMDIDRLAATSVDKDNRTENWVNFNAVQGSRMSANEHLVPEQFFNDPNATTKNVDGISAVKAIQIAASQGQKIYTIDQSNISTVPPLLNLKADTIQDIQNAVAAGKVVTTSQTTITKNGWTGSGYVILDPNTGAGAYLIGGGADGGLLLGLVLMILIPIIVMAFTGPIGGILMAYTIYGQMKGLFKNLNDFLDRGCSEDAIDELIDDTLTTAALLGMISVLFNFLSTKVFGDISGAGLAKMGVGVFVLSF